MEQLVRKLQGDFPAYHFTAGDVACWSPRTQEIHYEAREDHAIASWSVLHELGHALLGHDTYNSDVMLLQKESSAWTKAVSLAKQYGLDIDAGHIQNCLDTYRDWLHKRSTCPRCRDHGVQQKNTYTCLNCAARWRVSPARFCRSYRRKAK